MTKEPVERELVCEGRWCSISYAIRRDGTTAPAREVLDYLKEGTWSEGEDVAMHADEQVETYAALMQSMQHYAEHGDGDREESMNGLDDGIFEFKAGRARIAFFDTPGDGTFTPRWKISNRDDSPNPDSVTWHIPDLDPHIRLCNGWPKRGQKTNPGDISFARKVRFEDLEHDRKQR
ncbi:hypothetical protein GV791_14630 [Nocardia cyriacigeorgica]|uniref:Uncharacterized protein n=1 Tax=Nocardia cyriacigeorgica TaxID=135487 RepID=A0A6P1CMJ1_9NOCA|nr:hypothetical protein [Nocardia cyriacigeorgica]NEW33791.1 hypothetical protein [Nocardia cyriacigeorgica]